jgi:hypothetical protein
LIFVSANATMRLQVGFRNTVAAQIAKALPFGGSCDLRSRNLLGLSFEINIEGLQT